MANVENLKSLADRTTEEQRIIAKKGGIASGKARREKKIFKEAIEKQLGESIDSMVEAMIKQAKIGNVQAMTFLRDTIGEKPKDEVEQKQEVKVVMDSKLEDWGS